MDDKIGYRNTAKDITILLRYGKEDVIKVDFGTLIRRCVLTLPSVLEAQESRKRPYA